jgi:hypothetical protein
MHIGGVTFETPDSGSGSGSETEQSSGSTVAAGKPAKVKKSLNPDNPILAMLGRPEFKHGQRQRKPREQRKGVPHPQGGTKETYGIAVFRPFVADGIDTAFDAMIFAERYTENGQQKTTYSAWVPMLPRENRDTPPKTVQAHRQVRASIVRAYLEWDEKHPAATMTAGKGKATDADYESDTITV